MHNNRGELAVFSHSILFNKPVVYSYLLSCQYKHQYVVGGKYLEWWRVVGLVDHKIMKGDDLFPGPVWWDWPILIELLRLREPSPPYLCSKEYLFEIFLCTISLLADRACFFIQHDCMVRSLDFPRTFTLWIFYFVKISMKFFFTLFLYYGEGYYRFPNMRQHGFGRQGSNFKVLLPWSRTNPSLDLEQQKRFMTSRSWKWDFFI